MIYAQFNGINYKLEKRPVLTFSASETTFSEIVIDFTGKTASDLPIKYQEIKVIDTGSPDVTLYYGYCSQPSLPAFDGTQGRVLLTIELMSPQTYLTKRTIDILIEDINIHDAVDTILAGIVAHDGFAIESNDLPTTEYLSETISQRTIESVLTNLGGRFGFVWYVDELKKIYIKNLDNIEIATPVYELTDITTQYLKSVRPYFNVSDYANRLNFANVNLISTRTLLETGITLKDGESYTFIYPFSIGDSVVYRTIENPTEVLYVDTSILGVSRIYSDRALHTITYGSVFGFSGEDDGVAGKRILLQRDSSNPNLITGFKWVGATETIIDGFSYVALKPCTISYIDSVEIANNSTKINTSGIIEKTIDVNGKYYTYDEMTAYAKTLFRQNNKQADVVDLVFRGDYYINTLKDVFRPTEKIYIALPDQFIDGSDYVVTSGEFMIEQGVYTLSVQCRRANLMENYVDIFRKESGEPSEDKAQFVVYYSQDEKTVLSHKVIVDGEEVDV